MTNEENLIVALPRGYGDMGKNGKDGFGAQWLHWEYVFKVKATRSAGGLKV